VLGVTAALVLAAGLGVGVVLFAERGASPEPVVTPLATPAVPPSAGASAPVPPASVEPSGTAEGGEPLSEVEQASVEEEDEDRAPAVLGTSSMRARRTVSMRRGTGTAATTTTTTTTTTTPTVTQMVDESPTEMRATMSNGLVGLDEFDEGLRNR
jgi:hypothetical protein